jgi:hypothetical protein
VKFVVLSRVRVFIESSQSWGIQYKTFVILEIEEVESDFWSSMI